MRFVLRLAALPFTILFGRGRTYRLLVVGAFVVFMVLFSQHLAATAQSAAQPAGTADVQSVNPWDRPEDPLDTEDSGAQIAETADDEDCNAALGLPASIGCRVLTAGGTGMVAGVVGAAASSAFDGFVDSVADGAVYFLSQIASFLDTSTRPDVRSPGFARQFDTMVGLSMLILLPLVLVAIVDAVVHARPGQIARTLFIFVPVAAIATFVTLELVDMALVITDWASAYVSGGIATDTAAFLEGLGQVLSGTGGEQLPTFAVFIGALFTVFGAFLLWIELILRTAGINLAVLFLPLAFATLVWPRVSRWASKALRLLAALILSKFFIVAVISLGASLLAGADGSGVAGGGLESVIAGVSLITLATFAPWLLWRALAPIEGAAVLAMSGAGRSVVRAGGQPQGGQAPVMASRFSGAGGGPLPVAGVPAAGAAAGTARVARGASSAVSGGAAGAAGGGAAAGSASSAAARANADASARRRAAVTGSGTGGNGTGPGGDRGGGQRGGDQRPSPPTGSAGGSTAAGGGMPVHTERSPGATAPPASRQPLNPPTEHKRRT